jgi:hypothetical protein
MRIRLAENFRAVFYAPFYATQALGFYAREGVDVELIASSGPGDGVSALLGGTVDLTWGGPMRVMKARDQEPASPLVCFGEVVARDPFCLVGRSPRREFRLADLPGLRFAAVSEVPTPWMCLQHDLREQGVDPAGLDRARDRPMAGNFEALRDRRLDAIQVFEPFVSMAQAEGIGDVLYAAAARGPTAYTTFIVTRNGIARQTRRLRRGDARRSANAGLARRTRRGGTRRGHRAIFPRHRARHSDKRAPALSSSRALDAHSRCLASGVRAACRKLALRWIHLADARVRGLRRARPGVTPFCARAGRERTPRRNRGAVRDR